MASDLREYEVQFPADVEEFFSEAYAKQPADEQHLSSFSSIKRALVTPASYTSIRVNTVRTNRAAVVKQLTEKLCDFNARLRSSGRDHQVSVLPHPMLEDVVVLPSAPLCPSLGAQADSVDAEVVLDRLCGEAVLRGSDAFAKGIMAASSGLKMGCKVKVSVDLSHCTTRGSTVDLHKGRRVFIGEGMACMGRKQMFAAER